MFTPGVSTAELVFFIDAPVTEPAFHIGFAPSLNCRGFGLELLLVFEGGAGADVGAPDPEPRPPICDSCSMKLDMN